MVADFFEMDAWDTYYLGANTPEESIVQVIEEENVDILAISASMTFHLNKVSDMILKIKSSLKEHKVKIMVGGRPFNISKNLWKDLGADGYAADAQKAIKVASNLILNK